MPMKPQYDHDVVTSVTLWMDNRLLARGEAYVNTSGILYKQADASVAGVTYVSPYRSWVYDSCATGATIASGAYTSSGQFLTRASGLVIDYINGRIITQADWGASLTAAYARKEVNVYFSSLDEADFVLEQVYDANHNIQYPLTGFKGRALAAPLILLTNAREHNQPWSLGGMDLSHNTLRAFVITNSNYLQEGVNSLIRDGSDTYIPLCSYADAPITASGDLKGGSYNYCTGIYDRYGCANGLWIQDVYGYKLNERANRNTTFYLSIIDLDLEKPRLPGN